MLPSKLYEKTALSDLQGAWQTLRAEVAKAHPFPESDRLLFHIDEGMSWESVRHLDRMKAALLLVRNIVAQNKVPDEVAECVEQVVENLEEVEAAIAEGEKL